MFELDERLERDTCVIGELALCRVLLMNDAQFAWVILVPRIEGLTELIELNPSQELEFWQESRRVSQMLNELYSPHKLNIAALGNVVSQLHIHHIARFKHDVAWPQPVWGRQPAVPYEADALAERLTQMRAYLSVDV
tara:strand:+ start:328 stop:738 length:411 start_codon:yes stop_codon:yes gene_type:complete